MFFAKKNAPSFHRVHLIKKLRQKMIYDKKYKSFSLFLLFTNPPNTLPPPLFHRENSFAIRSSLLSSFIILHIVDVLNACKPTLYTILASASSWFCFSDGNSSNILYASSEACNFTYIVASSLLIGRSFIDTLSPVGYTVVPYPIVATPAASI